MACNFSQGKAQTSSHILTGYFHLVVLYGLMRGFDSLLAGTYSPILIGSFQFFNDLTTNSTVFLFMQV